jgi:hypothetical protein
MDGYSFLSVSETFFVSMQVIIGARQVFSSGPLQVAGDAQPSLRVEWSMTTWLSFETPVQPRPHKRLIIRKYLPNDDSGLSCWAWYTKVRGAKQVFGGLFTDHRLSSTFTR